MAESSADRRTDLDTGHVHASRALLSSLHPSGDPAEILTIDGPADEIRSARKADVMALAMTAAQCRNATQREALISRGLEAIADDGIVWVEAPGQWRSALAASLRARGLSIGNPVVLRARGAAHIEFTLSARGLRFALQSGLVSERWRPALAALERLPLGKGLLSRLLPNVGFAAFHRNTKPLAWLNGADSADIAVTTSWRGEQAPFLLFALGEEQTIVVKRGGAECRGQIAHEASLLKSLGSGLAKTHLEVPQLIDCISTPRFCSLVETPVPGRPMASLIRNGVHRDLRAIAERLAKWVGEWNRQTVKWVELTPTLGERLILSASRELAGTIDRGSAYLEWLSARVAQLIGQKVPLVAAHNDLTMANVLGDLSGIRSVIDWEAASAEGLPLTDFRYAMCDAAALIGGGDRLAGFRACFVDTGETAQLIQICEAPLRDIAGGPPEWLELCSHAGWVRHAANEQARSASSRQDGSFIAIANLLAGSVVDH